MTFGNPIWLWGLTGLALPLAIHLLSRKEGTVILIGSLRHLSDSNTQQFKSLRLNEILLLILRALLLITLVLFLADLRLAENGGRKLVIVDDEVNRRPEVQTALDSLAKSGYEIQMLSTFVPDMKKLNAWHVAEICKKQNLNSVVVVANDAFRYFQGQRVSLPANMKWIAVANTKTTIALAATNDGAGRVVVREGQSTDHNVLFDYATIEKTGAKKQFVSREDTLSVRDHTTVTVHVHASKEFQRDAAIVTAALHAMQDYFPGTSIQISERQEADWIIWLSDEKIPRAANMIAMAVRADAPLLLHDHPASWKLTRRLNESVALQENLTLSLASILLDDDAANKIALSHDIRSMPEEMMWSPARTLTAGVAQPAGQSMERLLLSVFLVLLLLERLVAYQRNQ